MNLLAKFGNYRSYRHGDINPYMVTLENAELTALIRHIGRFLKSEILMIYNSKVLDAADRETNTRRRTQAITINIPYYLNRIDMFM